MTADAVQINETVDRPQNIVGGNMVLNPKVVKQTLLHHQPLAYHRSNPRLNLKAVNQLRAAAATTSFSTISSTRRSPAMSMIWSRSNAKRTQNKATLTRLELCARPMLGRHG